MSSTQVMLELAIKDFGINDIVTIMLSQKRDKEVTEKQSELFNQYKLRQASRKFKEEI